MTTNARSMTSPVSTFANQFPASTATGLRTPTTLIEHRRAPDWWERPPATAGAVHVSLRSDWFTDSTSPTRTSPTRPHSTRTSSTQAAFREAARSSSRLNRTVQLAPVGRICDQQSLRTGAPMILRRTGSGDRQLSQRSRLRVFSGILLAVLVGGFGIANAASSSKGEVRTYVVRPGDSFWSIARSVQLRGDLRPLVADLVEEHGSNSLQVGDRVELPAR